MARRCIITGKGRQTGNRVSHSNIKSKRVFLCNLKSKRVFSQVLGRWVRLRISAAGLRTLEKRGVDAVLAELRERGELP